MGDINLRILMSAIGGASVVGAVGSIASSLGSGGLGGALIATGLAAATLAATLAVTATKAAGNFQSELSSLSTGAGESVKNLGMVNDGLLKMAVDTGTTTKQLTSGLYMIESGGYHGAAGLAILQAAAQGAKVGNADLGVVADATDTVLKNFGDTGLTASNAVNTLVATVSRGKTHMGDLSTSLSQILPTASAARVGLNDVMGAMSTMTGEGIPAANAATYLRQMLIALQAPSAGSVKALSAIGLTTGDVADAMHKSLPGALQMITDKLKSVYGEGTPEYLAAVKNISGGSKTMQGMLDLTGTHLTTFKDNVTGIAASVKAGGNSIVGWSQVQGNFNQKISEGKEIIETLSIRLGQLLLPAVTGVLTAVLPLASSFSTMLTTVRPLSPVFSQIASMFGIMKTNWMSSAPAFAPVLQAFQHFGALLGGSLPSVITQFMLGLNEVNTVIGIVAVAVSAWISPALSILSQIFKGVMSAMVPVQNAIQGQLLPAFQNLVSAIAPIVTHILQWIANSGVITPLIAGLGVAVGVVVGIISGLVNILASVITFFTQTQVGVTILQAVFVTLGIVLGVIAVAVLPGLIAGFVSTAIAAIATGVSIALAFLPITLIVLGIIVVIALVILIIKNWGSIIHWLQTVWQGFVSWISPAISKVGQVFTNVFNGIKTFLQNAWNFIVNAAKAGAMLLLAVVIGPIGLLVIFVIQHWSQISAFISTVIAAIVVIVETGWNNLTSSVRNIATGLWNNVVNIFNNAKNSIGNAVHGIWDSITGIMAGWPADALQAGINIVNGIANGIRNAVGTVTDAIKHVTDTIGSFLPHSPAKQGELSHLNEYGPNLVGGISTGVIQSLPIMANAMKMLTAPIGASLTGQSIALNAASSSSAPMLTHAPVSSITSTANPSASTAGASPVTQNITLTVQIYAQQVDPDELDRIAQYTVKYFGDEIHAQFGNV